VVNTGTWRATTIEIGYGGTGLTGTPTAGQLLIGNSTGYTLATITGTSNRVSVTNANGSITLSAPQDIHTTATPLFASVNVGPSEAQGTLSQNASYVMTLYPGSNDGTIRLGGTSATYTSVLPGRALGASLGSATDKFLTIHAAELQVQTLVAADTLATTGGRVIVAYSTKLINTVTDVATVIQVEHNNLSLNDFVMFEARGKTEHMKIGTHGTPDSGKIYKTVTGGFEYAVTRNMDLTGANQWEKGDALVNTGVGFIEMFSEWGASGAPLNYIFNYNNGGDTFSANYSNSTAWSPFGNGANTEVNDAIYFGQGDGAGGCQWSNLYFYIGTAAVYSATLVWEYYNGTTGWEIFTPTIVGGFDSLGWMSVEWDKSTLSWGASFVNGLAAHWIRCRISAFTYFTTLPITDKFRVYSRKKNVGPSIVGNVRNGSVNFNDWTEHWAIGNLNGLYGYGTDVFGVGLGKYGTTYATLDSTNGYSFYNSTTLVSRWDAFGNITVGPVSSLTSNVYISGGKIQLRKNTTTLIELDSTGTTAVINVGETTTGKSRVNIDSDNGIRMISNIGGTDREFARWHLDGKLRIGEIADSVSRVEITTGGILNFITRVSGNDYTSGSISAAGAWTIGRVANSTSHITIDATNGIQIINQSSGGTSTTLGQWDISGNLILGKVAASSNNMILNGSTLEFRNNTTVLGSLNANVWTLGAASGAQKVTIDTSGVRMYTVDGANVVGEFAAVTKIGLQADKHIEIDATNGIVFYDDATVIRASITSTEITMGDPAAGIGNNGTNTYITDSAIALRYGTTAVIQLNSDGTGFVSAGKITWDAAGSVTVAGTINASAGNFTGSVVVGTSLVAGVLQSYGKTGSDSGSGFYLCGAANGTSALFDLRSTSHYFNWNGTTLTFKAANAELTSAGSLWATAGGFGGTSSATPKVFIDGDGLFLKDGLVNRVFLREDGDLWLDQSTQKTPITVPNFSFETEGTPVANWDTIDNGGTLSIEIGAGNVSNGSASLKLEPSDVTGIELISSAAYSPGASDYVITFDYKSAYNQEHVTTPSRFYIKIVSTSYVAVGTSNVIKSFELPIGTNQAFTTVTLGFTTAADFKIVFGTKIGNGTGSIVPGYIDNVRLVKYIPAIELSKYGFIAYTSDANYVKVGIGGLEIKGGAAEFDNLVIHGDLLVYGTQTVFVTGNGLSGTTSPSFTIGTTTTPGGANISTQFGTSAHYLRLNTSSQFDISGVLNWPSGSSTQANTAYAHSQETTGAVHGATDANTANKIVRRDASGNFTATTITAALAGNASTASAWATGRTITLTGNVTGVSGSWTGSGNISFVTSIAALAVTNAMLAGSIADSKLNQITTTDKVSGTAITTGDISTAGNININTNTSMFKFLGVAINTTYTVDYAVSTGIAENTVLDLDSGSATWTADPGTGNRRYQAGANRMLVFVDGRLMRKGTGNDYLECDVSGNAISSGSGRYIKFLFDVYSGGTITLVVFAV
jgi:hypothetical protein